MKVELSIKDDRELRNHIKDVIKGEVVSIARGEIKGIIAEVFKDKFEGRLNNDAEALIKSEIQDMVRKGLGSTGGWGSPSALKTIAREITEKYIKEAFKGGIVK